MMDWEPEWQMLDKLCDANKNMDLEPNISKTKVVVFDRDKGVNDWMLYMYGEKIEQVYEFVKMGEISWFKICKYWQKR